MGASCPGALTIYRVSVAGMGVSLADLTPKGGGRWYSRRALPRQSGERGWTAQTVGRTTILNSLRKLKPRRPGGLKPAKSNKIFVVLDTINWIPLTLLFTASLILFCEFRRAGASNPRGRAI